jgi:hypothetical protein
MRVPEEPVCIDLFRQNPVFTSLHLKSPVHVHRLRIISYQDGFDFKEIVQKTRTVDNMGQENEKDGKFREKSTGISENP